MTPVPVASNLTHAQSGTEQPQKQSPSKGSPRREHPATRATAAPDKHAGQPSPLKKVSRRSSKPIINWFQRKLTGGTKPKRADNLPVDIGRGKGRGGPVSSRAASRITSSPLPSPAHGGRQQARLEALAAARRKTISLNGNDIRDFIPHTDDEDDESERSSLARESTWSPSALEADEDASLRPLPPSTPPSPSPSRSSSSYLSDPRTFRSMAASTKPTTLLSIDLHGGGMAHIAQAPLTPLSQINRMSPHIRSSSTATNPGLLGSGASITFSALPSSPQSTSRPSSVRNPGSINSSNPSSQQTTAGGPVLQAPLHTTHHPRNNPRPSSPPMDNASVLTLASSAYAMPGLRLGVGASGYHSAAPSALGGGDSLSHFGGSITFADAESTSQYVMGDEERLEERDVDASVRALRPRSSRRGSWESEASRWSARIQMGPGTPSLARERSLWTTNSVRTGGFSADNVGEYDHSQSDGAGSGSGEVTEEALRREAQRTQSPVSGLLDVDMARRISTPASGDLEGKKILHDGLRNEGSPSAPVVQFAIDTCSEPREITVQPHSRGMQDAETGDSG